MKKIESPHKFIVINYSVCITPAHSKTTTEGTICTATEFWRDHFPVYYHDMFMDERRWQNCNFPCTSTLSLRQYQVKQSIWVLKFKKELHYIFRIKFFLVSVVAGLMLFTWIMKISIGHVCPRNKELTPRGASCTTSWYRF